MKRLNQLANYFFIFISLIHFFEMLNFTYNNFKLLALINFIGFVNYMFYLYYNNRYKICLIKKIKLGIITSTLYIFIHLLFVWKSYPETYLWALSVLMGILLFLKGKTMFKYLTFTFILFATAPVISETFELSYTYIDFDTNYNDYLKLLFLTVFFFSITSVFTIYSYKEFSAIMSDINTKERDDQNEKEEINRIKDNLVENEIVNIEEQQLKKLFKKIESYIETEKPFLDHSYNLKKLSIDIGSNTTYVSRSINLNTNKNFNEFINKYKIEYFKNSIEKNDYITSDSLKSLYIKSGFKHQSTFNRIFKQFEGITPSEYIKNKY